jgi:hypothetical protein
VIIIPRRVGQRIVGSHGFGTITGLGTLRGEQVVYLLWDAPMRVGENPEWRDTMRARDVVVLGQA